MQLDRYVEDLRRQFAASAAAGGQDVRAVAERLVSALDAAVRLTLLEALSAAADEITGELAPGSVTVRLRGRDPEFDVTPATPDGPEPPAAGPHVPDPGTDRGDGADGDGGVARINLRVPDHLKGRIERAAEREGLSVNAWLVRVLGAAVEQGRHGAHGRPDAPHGRAAGARFTGWVR